MPELEAINAYSRLALRARRQGAAEQALLFLSNALRLARECGLPLLEARTRHAMGQIYALSGRPEIAACCCRTALGLLSAAAPAPSRQRMAKAISSSLAAFEQA